MESTKQTDNAQQGRKVRVVPLDSIRSSCTNPRRTFTGLEELAESIRRHGVLQPPQVLAVGDGAYELVFGERRWRAARMAGLTNLRVEVVSLSPAEVVELQLVENAQREGVHPLEEADGFLRLQKEHGYTTDALVARTGKPRAYVLGRLQLCHLGKAGRKAYEAGLLSDYAAMAVARIPGDEQQAKAVEALTSRGDVAGPRAVRDIIQRHFMLALKSAPFPTKDAKLLPEAGPCTTCPRRTGACADLFGDLDDKNLCTDAGCFEKKTQAAWTRAAEKALAEGHEVLDEGASEELFVGDRVRWGSPFVDLRERCQLDGLEAEGKTWGEVLGGLRPPVTIARSDTGRAAKLVKREDALRVLQEAGLLQHAEAPQDAGDAKASAKALRERRTQEKGVVRAAIDTAVQRAEASEASEALLRLVARGFVRASWDEVLREVGKRRGLDAKAAPIAHQLLQAVESLAVPALLGLLVELTATRFAHMPNGAAPYGQGLLEACTLFGIDVAALERQVAEKERDRKEGCVCPRCHQRAKRFVLQQAGAESICVRCHGAAERRQKAAGKSRAAAGTSGAEAPAAPEEDDESLAA